MSVVGITFDNQGPTAANHGVLFGAAFSDGVLRGCDVSFLGASLTIAPGYIIAAGRLCQIVAPEVFSVSAASGVARIVLQIDLSKPATESNFEQLSFVMQTASSREALPALVREDVNAGGIIYQLEICTAALSSAGITAVEQPRAAAVASLRFTDVTVPVSSFASNATYADFPYRASVSLAGVTAGMVPEVVFGVADAMSGIFAPVAGSYNGGVYIYASEVPAASITIPVIILWR